jgi:hypothetical protein
MGLAPGRPHSYVTPDTLPLNSWALSGNWTANPESVVLHHPKGGISFRFHARDVHLVMGAMDGSTPVAFRIEFLDRGAEAFALTFG